MIKNNQIILSQSTTKDLGLYIIDDQLEEIEWCPKQVYHKHIADDYPREPSKVMLQGLYAESLLLGSCARGEVVTDLPKKKNGETSVIQERIDIQMQRMYGYMYAKGVRLNEYNKQVPLLSKYAKGIWLRGEMDVFPVMVDGKQSIVDIKTTKDVTNTFFTYKNDKIRFTSNSCWGVFDNISKNQPLFYHHIARNFKNVSLDVMIKYKPEKEDAFRWLYEQEIDNPTFNFLVAGIDKTEYDDQLATFEYEWNGRRSMLLELLIQRSIEKMQDGIKTNFEASPQPYLCKGCAMADVCSKSLKKI